MVHQITHAFYHHAPVVFTTILRRVCFLLKLFQRRCILLLCTRLIELRLQEIHHLIKTDITAAYRRQQLFQLIKVVARQQMFLGLFQANP